MERTEYEPIYFRPVYHFETTRNSVEALAPEICTLQEGLGLQAGLAVETIACWTAYV
jgi:hypothetical protein